MWETTEPLYSTADVHLVGVNSVRPWRHQSGGVGDAQLARVAERLAQAPAGALRIVALHHQLIGAPWRTRKKPVARRNHVLASLVDAGAELILGGHIHQGTVSERNEFEVMDGDARGVVISIAPGLGRPRPHRRGEARGCVAYRADDESITVETSIWRGDGWEPTAVRRFPRGRKPLPSSTLGRARRHAAPDREQHRGDDDPDDELEHAAREDQPAMISETTPSTSVRIQPIGSLPG